MKESYLNEIKDKVDATEKAKRPHKVVWQTNIAFFQGYHYHDYTHRFGLKKVHRGQQYRVELTENYVRAITLTMAAKLTQNRPAWTVLPATKDLEDIEKARTGQRLLDYLWEKCDCQRKLYEMALHMVLTGQGYWCIYWNASAGEALYDDKGKFLGMSGFPEVDVVLSFDIGLDPTKSTIKDCEWGYRRRVVSVDWVERMFNKTVKGGLEADGETPNRAAQADFFDQADTDKPLTDEYVELIEFYDTIKKRYTFYLPNQNKVVASGDWSLPVPFIQCRAIPNIGDISPDGIAGHENLGQTPITDIVQLQKVLNRAESQIIEIKNMLAFPRLLASDMADINPLDLVDRPGSMIRWSGVGHAPTPLSLGNIPGWVFQLPDRIIDRMRDISGIHEISYGGSVGSIQSGRGLAIMAEQDATKFAPMSRSLSGEAVREAGMMLLRMWRAFSNGQSTIRVVGQSGALEVATFFGDDLTADDVYVQEGSTYATNKALRTDQILQAWNFGLIEDRRKVNKILEFGDVDAVFGDIDIHRLRQRREIDMILQGVQVGVEPWEDDYTHLDELSTYLNSTSYDKLSPEQKDGLRQHYMMHMQRYQLAMQQQQMAAQQRGVAAAGAPQSSITMPPAEGQPSPGLDAGQEAFPAAGAGRIAGGVNGNA